MNTPIRVQHGFQFGEGGSSRAASIHMEQLNFATAFANGVNSTTTAVRGTIPRHAMQMGILDFRNTLAGHPISGTFSMGQKHQGASAPRAIPLANPLGSRQYQHSSILPAGLGNPFSHRQQFMNMPASGGSGLDTTLTLNSRGVAVTDDQHNKRGSAALNPLKN